MGVHGYTAYSASKFALRGLAEALQHEVISDNIRVSLIFPPDTETPGFIEGIYASNLSCLIPHLSVNRLLCKVKPQYLLQCVACILYLNLKCKTGSASLTNL